MSEDYVSGEAPDILNVEIQGNYGKKANGKYLDGEARS